MLHPRQLSDPGFHLMGLKNCLNVQIEHIVCNIDMHTCTYSTRTCVLTLACPVFSRPKHMNPAQCSAPLPTAATHHKHHFKNDKDGEGSQVSQEPCMRRQHRLNSFPGVFLRTKKIHPPKKELFLTVTEGKRDF